MLIVLEGIDCSGKTTATQLLAAQMGMVSYATPPSAFRKERNRIDADASPHDHYLFYLEGIRLASVEIKQLLSTGASVVCDRYWLTTYVYHTIMGLSVNIDDFKNLVLPDLTVLLLVGPDVQAKRFLQRGLSVGDRRMINVQRDLEQEYVRTLAHLQIHYFSVSTDHMAPQEVVRKIITELP